MLRISKMADYATVVMVYLARHEGKRNNAKVIATECQIKQPTASKLLKLLANSGLLTSARGVTGGYTLARPAEHISVAEIINAVEGTAGLTECSLEEGICTLEPVCSIRGNWQLINHAVQTALDSVSLAALAQPVMQETAIDVSEITQLGQEETRKS